MKKTGILSLLVLSGAFFISSAVLAASSNVYLSPSAGTKTVGAAFTESAFVDPAGNQVCVVQGSLVFNNVTCNSVSVASGLMAQTTPTCDNPSFTVGIPKCTTSLQNILSVSVKGVGAGPASISFSGLKIIGNGVADTFSASGANYTMQSAAVKPTTTTQQPPAVEQPAPSIEQTTTPSTQNIAIPKTAGEAALSVTANWLDSPIVLVFVIILAILLILWLAEKFISHKKKKT